VTLSDEWSDAQVKAFRRMVDRSVTWAECCPIGVWRVFDGSVYNRSWPVRQTEFLAPEDNMPRIISRREFGGLTAVLGAQGRRLLGATNRVGKLDDTLRSGIAQRKIPAAVGMAASESSILYSGAFGTRDSSGVPVDSDSIFALASMTKAITTVAALQLVEQGKVKLDEPVSQHLPQLDKLEVLEGFDSDTGKAMLRPARTPVTLKHLLTHTSGMCYDIWDRDMFQYTSKTKGAVPAVPPLMFEPGLRWQYGMGVDWAGRLVEVVSGMNLESTFRPRFWDRSRCGIPAT